MDCLFDISIPNIIEELNKDRLRSEEAKIEDINFIIDQRGERKMYIGYEDLKYSKSVNDKSLREKRSSIAESYSRHNTDTPDQDLSEDSVDEINLRNSSASKKAKRSSLVT